MTQQITGALSKIVIGFQPDKDTIATDGFELPYVSETLSRNRNKVKSKVMRGNFNPSKPSPGNINAAGKLVVPMDSVASWYWFKAMFNTLDTNGTGPYNHVFKMSGTAQTPYITIEKQFLDGAAEHYFQYIGCKINGFSFSIGDEGEQLMNLDVIAIDRIISPSAFDSAPTVVNYSPLDFGDSALKIGGTILTTSPGVSLNVAFNIDNSNRFVGGGGKVGVLTNTQIGVNGNHKFIFENVTHLQMAVDNTETSLEQSFIKAADKKVVIQEPEVQFSEKDPAISGPKGLAADLDYEAYYDNDASESSIVVTVTNGDAHD